MVPFKVPFLSPLLSRCSGRPTLLASLVIGLAIGWPLPVGTRSALAQDLTPKVSGKAVSIRTIDTGVPAFSNRGYIWENVPEKFRGWQYTLVAGGAAAEFSVTVPIECDLYIISPLSPDELPEWQLIPDAHLSYSDDDHTAVSIYRRHFSGGTVLSLPLVPGNHWVGTMVLAPKLVPEVPPKAPVPSLKVLSPGNSAAFVPSLDEPQQVPPDQQVNDQKEIEKLRRLEDSAYFNDLLAEAQTWQKAQPNAVESYYYEGIAHYYLGQLPQASEDWRHLSHAASTNFDKIGRGDARLWMDKTSRLNAAYPDLKKPWEGATDDTLKSRSLKNEATNLLLQKDYDGIEKRLAVLERNGDAAANGDSYASMFEQGLHAWGGNDDRNAEKQWQENHDLTEEWNKARPNSALAKLRLANSWKEGGLVARGNTTDIKSPELYDERMAKAEPLYRALYKDQKGEKSALFYNSLLDFVYQMSPDLTAPEHIFHEASTAYPHCYELYATKAFYMLPRWMGQPGDWERFAAHSADAVGGDDGDMLYARLIWFMAQFYATDRENVWEVSKPSWPRAQHGFALIMKQNPRARGMATGWFYMAAQKKDWAAALVPLQTYIGEEGDDSFWNSDGDFASWRMAVLENSLPKP